MEKENPKVCVVKLIQTTTIIIIVLNLRKIKIRKRENKYI